MSKASGGRTLPHFGRASGSDTGENSEICAGTRRRVFSNCASGVGCGMTRDAEFTPHQALCTRAPLRTASDINVASAFLPVVFALVQRHCIGMPVAIRLPALAKLRVFAFNHLVQLPFQTLCHGCNLVAMSRTESHPARGGESCATEGRRWNLVDKYGLRRALLSA